MLVGWLVVRDLLLVMLFRLFVSYTFNRLFVRSVRSVFYTSVIVCFVVYFIFCTNIPSFLHSIRCVLQFPLTHECGSPFDSYSTTTTTTAITTNSNSCALAYSLFLSLLLYRIVCAFLATCRWCMVCR